MSDDSRPFGAWTAAAMVVGTMIGSGIFVLPAQLAPFGWTAAMAWIIAGAGAALLAYFVVDLTRAMPDEPSIVAICGRVLGGPAGMLIGWSYWVSVWVSNAAVATTAARYLGQFKPSLSATPLASILTAIAILAALTGLNLTGARSVGRFQIVTTLLKLAPLLVVVVIIAASLAGGTLAQPVEPAAFTGDALTPALGIVFVALVGFEGAAIVTERVRDPARNVMRGTLWGVAASAVLYLVICTGMTLLSPLAELETQQAPMAWFVERFLGSGAGLAVAAFAAISCIGLLNSAVLFLGEVPLASVRAGELAPWAARTNSRDVAVAPMIAGTFLSAVLMLGTLTRGGGDVLDFMFKLTTSSSMWLYMAACAAALALGRHRVLAWTALAFAVWVLYAIGIEAAGWGVVLILAGIPLYFLARPSAPAQQPA